MQHYTWRAPSNAIPPARRLGGSPDAEHPVRGPRGPRGVPAPVKPRKRVRAARIAMIPLSDYVFYFETLPEPFPSVSAATQNYTGMGFSSARCPRASPFASCASASSHILIRRPVGSEASRALHERPRLRRRETARAAPAAPAHTVATPGEARPRAGCRAPEAAQAATGPLRRRAHVRERTRAGAQAPRPPRRRTSAPSQSRAHAWKARSRRR